MFNRLFNRFCVLAILILGVIMPKMVCAVGLTKTIQIYFELDKFDIDPNVGNNKQGFDELKVVFDYITSDPSLYIEGIEINGNTSPEAGVAYNKILSTKRANALKDYIQNSYPLADSLIDLHFNGISWGYLRDLVSSSDMKAKNQVLAVIDNIPEETWGKANASDKWVSLLDSRLKRLMDLEHGKPYRYMAENFFPLMRNSTALAIHYSIRPALLEKTYTLEPCPKVEISVPHFAKYTDIPVVAIKTNLLYDVVAMTNIEVEVPIGNRVSLTGEFIFPWYYLGGVNYTCRTHTVHLGVNYWLGKRTVENKLQGWHVGAYAGFGDQFDLQLFHEEGIQGSYLSAGATVGYTYAFAKRWYLEAQAGFGWLQSDYKEYTMAYGTKYGDVKVHDYPWLTNRYTWFGPTQLRVSIMWVITKRKKIE